jgi:uncharacterized membrane protein (DUF441 family)
MISLDSTTILLVILAISILGKADSVAIATCLLLLIKLIKLDQYIFPLVEKKGVPLGLIFLIAAILIPLANGKIAAVNIKSVFTSWVGITALVLSLVTTYLSGLGLRYLTVEGHGDIMPSLIIGSVIAAAFFRGVPVGPFITSGILALVVRLFNKNY